ncbi:hypothetical protein GCM10025868_26730 [Angustibacter aerolatus]|uniref:Uncharacterized protein n=1 Tax=Angustibacter aerolatus TaxID=1162965 RepID=A0ABQ6JJ34_9ACTN|nr:hypothetical protein [Angustibacter aerolatus]GMA87423.1 hypothetical protein GCM10025868_26730 [Angustibacter aerolatus]
MQTGQGDVDREVHGDEPGVGQSNALIAARSVRDALDRVLEPVSGGEQVLQRCGLGGGRQPFDDGLHRRQHLLLSTSTLARLHRHRPGHDLDDRLMKAYCQ